MNASIRYTTGIATVSEIVTHLRRCDACFRPALSSRLDVDAYAAKLVQNAVRLEAWSDDALAGLLAVYCNDPSNDVAFVSNMSVLAEVGGRGIGGALLERCVQHCRTAGVCRIALEVSVEQQRAVRLYEKHGFSADAAPGPFINMHLNLESRKTNERPA